MSNDASIPAGFAQVERGGPFFMGLAPVYRRQEDDGSIVLALCVARQHSNKHGNAHGGMLATLADGALHDNLLRGREDGARIVTVSMSMDFIGPGRPGDWIEARVSITKQGRSLCFADCVLRVGQRVVLRASGVFSQVSRPLPEGPAP